MGAGAKRTRGASVTRPRVTVARGGAGATGWDTEAVSDPSGGFPSGPPMPPTSAPPAPPTDGPTPVEPRRRLAPKVAIAGAIVFVISFGLGLGLVLGGADDSSDDEPQALVEEAPETTTSDETPEVDPQDPFADADSLDDLLSELPEGFEDLVPDDFLDDLSDLDLDEVPTPGDAQATLIFATDADPDRIEEIRQEWEGTPVLSFVQFLDSEEVDDVLGGDLPGPDFATITAFGDDAEAVRDFACSYEDDEAVELVQVFGAEPCGQST